jgi:hypothetical protein
MTGVFAWQALTSPDVAPAQQVIELESADGKIVLVDQAMVTAANRLWREQMNVTYRSDAAKPITPKIEAPDPRLSPRASRSHARTRIAVYGWSHKEFVCLDQLWTHESNWRSNAYNHTPVNGKHAGGIPQILGLDPDTPTTRQIQIGLDYIKTRYGSPCAAWAHWKRKAGSDLVGGWY